MQADQAFTIFQNHLRDEFAAIEARIAEKKGRPEAVARSSPDLPTERSRQRRGGALFFKGSVQAGKRHRVLGESVPGFRQGAPQRARRDSAGLRQPVDGSKTVPVADHIRCDNDVRRRIQMTSRNAMWRFDRFVLVVFLAAGCAASPVPVENAVEETCAGLRACSGCSRSKAARASPPTAIATSSAAAPRSMSIPRKANCSRRTKNRLWILEKPANHIGDISVHDGELFAGIEWFVDGRGQRHSDRGLTMPKRSATRNRFDWEPESGQVEVSALAVDADNGLVWMTDWVNGTYIYRYDIASGTYAGKLHLRPVPQWQQGIAAFEVRSTSPPTTATPSTTKWTICGRSVPSQRRRRPM